MLCSIPFKISIFQNYAISYEIIKFERVFGQFCIETLHESRKWKSNGLSCLFEEENKMSKL